ncbi:MAG: membrane dipeptidase [Clostridia bacterium]|nr:membrane dipeptidase [Clostridia bacterium]
MKLSKLSLIDLHCDTLCEIERNKTSLLQNDLTISLQTVEPYQHYAQFFASWCSHRLDDEQGYSTFLRMSDYLDAQLAIPEVAARMVKVTNAQQLTDAWAQGKHAAILAIEDARILAGDLSRLDVLAAHGVRYATLQWSGETCIGGAHDTETGLTDFGKQVVCRCFELGIVPDLSHTNARSAQDAIDLAMAAGQPLLATHSNAYSIYPHSRNLRDEHFIALRELGGLVGLNFCRPHLWDPQKETVTVSHIIRHLEHFLSLGGEDTVAIGADWDGAPLPEGFSTIADAQKLANELCRLGYTDSLIEKLFFGNALAFIQRNFR